jgi:hypothetical protein
VVDKLNDLGNISANVPHEYRKYVEKHLKHISPTELFHKYIDWANLILDAKRLK